MTVNMSILYPNSNSTQSKVYYSNTRPQFCMNRALLSFRAILHLRKIPKHCKKLMRFFSILTERNSFDLSNLKLEQTKNILW